MASEDEYRGEHILPRIRTSHRLRRRRTRRSRSRGSRHRRRRRACGRTAAEFETAGDFLDLSDDGGHLGAWEGGVRWDGKRHCG